MLVLGLSESALGTCAYCDLNQADESFFFAFTYRINGSEYFSSDKKF